MAAITHANGAQTRDIMGAWWRYVKHGLPRGLTLAYRLMPYDKVRWLWSMESPMGSAEALLEMAAAEIAGRGSWAVFLRYNHGWLVLPGYLMRRAFGRPFGWAPGRGDWKRGNP
jgi:hypothetical protein